MTAPNTPHKAQYGEWQDIESAPRDGSEILLAFGFGTGDVPPPLVCAWSKYAWQWLIVGVELEVLTPATHWMPLPPPPVSA